MTDKKKDTLVFCGLVIVLVAVMVVLLTGCKSLPGAGLFSGIFGPPKPPTDSEITGTARESLYFLNYSGFLAISIGILSIITTSILKATIGFSKVIGFMGVIIGVAILAGTALLDKLLVPMAIIGGIAGVGYGAYYLWRVYKGLPNGFGLRRTPSPLTEN